jgi:hypothetical protein
MLPDDGRLVKVAAVHVFQDDKEELTALIEGL